MPDPPGRMLLVIALAAVSLLIPLSIPLARSVTRPLEDLAVAARALGEGGASKRLDFTRQDEIGDLGRTFDDMATRIAQLRRAEKELLANVSHELRTPIARLRVVLAIIEEDVARAQTYLPELATDLSELERLVDEILVAARLALEKGDFVESTLPLRPEPVAIDTVFEAVAERFRSLVKDDALIVDCRVGQTLIEADKVLLRRAIDNLVDNAHKYGASESAIELRGYREGDAVVIDVVDRGRGIPQSELLLVFTPFYRADPSRTRATGGVGLGLPLAKRIVEAHGGTLTLVSVEGQGTTVRIRIPAIPPASA